MSDSHKKIQILVDEPDLNPGDEFDRISKTVSEVIINSKAQFTIGITGDWGTGKTTMMQAIHSNFLLDYSEKTIPNDRHFLREFFDLKKKISSNDSPTVQNTDDEFLPEIKNELYPTTWFNAWRFEREETKATIPLMIIIIERLLYWIHQKESENYDKSILSKLRKDIVSFLNSCDYHLQVGIPGIATFDVNRGEQSENNDNYNSIQGIRKPVLQKGLDIISEIIFSLRKKDKNFRLIVFVDDLDRCSPRNALQVLESVKILLGIEGIIYVLGISDKTISKLIDVEYKDTGIKGEDYIKKIIQIKYPLRTWTPDDITDLIKNNILDELGENAPNFLIDEDTKEDNYKMISDAIDSNPRELKRFINNLILSFELFKDKGINVENLLIIEALKSRLEEFFVEFSKEDSNFKETISQKINLSLVSIKQDIAKSREDTKGNISYEEEILDKITPELWAFLQKVLPKLNSIKDNEWQHYLKATESIKDMKETPTYSEDEFNEKMYELLINGKIHEFNKTRPNAVNLSHADFRRLDLSNANLSNCILKDVNLGDTNLSNADLSGAVLDSAKMQGTNLSGVDFSDVKMSLAIFSNVNLNDADFISTKPPMFDNVIVSPSYERDREYLDNLPIKFRRLIIKQNPSFFTDFYKNDSYDGKANKCMELLKDTKWKWRSEITLINESNLSSIEFDYFVNSNPKIIKSKIPDEHGNDLFSLKTKFE